MIIKHKKFIVYLLVMIMFAWYTGGMLAFDRARVYSDSVSLPYNITNNFGEDASTELLVQWHNDSTISSQTLLLTHEDDAGFSEAQAIVASGTPFSLSNNLGNFPLRNIFRLHLEGLTPNTSYIYKVGQEGAWSRVFYHKTAGASTNFSFSVITDPQSETHDLMLNALNAANDYDSDNRFFLNGGDLVNDIGERPDEIASYTRTSNEINVRTPIATTQGNHDTYGIAGDNVYLYGESTVYNAFITNPQNGCEPNLAKSQSYYFYYSNVLVIMLNTMVEDYQHTLQKEWLKDVLENDKDNELSQYVIVTMHMGVFGNNYFEHYFMTKMRNLYGKIFSDYDVDIVFSGHDHTYARTNPLKIGAGGIINSFEAVENGTVYTIAGISGPAFRAGTSDVKADEMFVVRSKANLGTSMFVNVKVSNTELTVTASYVNGTIIDTYTVPAKREWAIDPIENMRVKIAAKVNSAAITLDAQGIEGISKIELQRPGGSVVFTNDGSERQFDLTELRANSSYKYNVVAYFNEGESKTFSANFATKGFLKKVSGDYLAIVGQDENTANYKVFLNGDFLFEYPISMPGCKVTNMATGGNYLVRVELYDLNKTLLGTDHLFFEK